MAVLTPTPVAGKILPDVNELAHTTIKLVAWIYFLYLFWDLLSIWMDKSRITTNGTKQPRYPEVEDNKMTTKAKSIDWAGFLITLASFIFTTILWLAHNCCTPRELFIMAIVLLLAYRWAKEIRTSCKSLRQA